MDLFTIKSSAGSEITVVPALDKKFQSRLLHFTDAYQVEGDFGDLLFQRVGFSPAFIEPIRKRISWDTQGRYCISRNYSIDKNENEIFVQNAELHTHGFNAPDLSLGTYPNAVILKELIGYDYGIMKNKNVFQEFGIPKKKAADSFCVQIH